ncbi:MAG: transglycosylase SLT domain-containing protein [Polyangiaceae bacterium]|nr:transglycosylase SLT domain-containing protein [Polyangiaceae bacterium]
MIAGHGITRSLAAACAMLLWTSAGCKHDAAKNQESDAGGAEAGLPLSAATGVTGADAGHGENPREALRTAVSSSDWPGAARLFEGLPAETKARPELRYLGARIAVEQNKDAEALGLLEGLEATLPLLSDAIALLRADVQSRIGPYAAAGEILSRQRDARSLLKAALAFERAGKPDEVVRVTSQLLRDAKRSKAEETHARSLRLQYTPASGSQDDARWLYVHAPETPGGAAAAARLGPKPDLDGEAWLTRALAFAEAGKLDEARSAADRVPQDHKKRASCPRGDVLYKAKTAYTEAFQAYGACAADPGPNQAEYAFLSARALSRADQDDKAIAAFARVESRFPKSPFAEQASFLAARLHLLHGKWKEAARAFDEADRRYPRPKNPEERTRDRALAHLLDKDPRTARRLFEDLAGSRDPLESARAAMMAALAALEDGERLFAIGRWTDIARNYPLTWPALVARAHLTALKAPLPPTIETGDPRAVADAPLLVRLPSPVDLLHDLGLDDDAERALVSRESLLVEGATARARSTELTCQAYGTLDRGERRHELVPQLPKDMLASAPGPRNGWAWHCAYPEPFSPIVTAAGQEHGVAPALTYAIMRAESSYRPAVLSPVGAVGLLQLMPDTARKVSKDVPLDGDVVGKLKNPRLNIQLGVRFLHDLQRTLKSDALAAAAYNAGSEAVGRWAKRLHGIDLDVFVELIPYGETRVYVARVMGNLARYGYLQAGESGVPALSLPLPDVDD